MIDKSPDDVAGYTAQARELLVKGRQYLAAGKLHRASEKGWEAATHMAKAVALAQGWQYSSDSHFHVVMNRLREIIDDFQIANLHGRAVILHCNGDIRKKHLDAEAIAEDLDKMAELVELLSPLTGIAE